MAPLGDVDPTYSTITDQLTPSNQPSQSLGAASPVMQENPLAVSGDIHVDHTNLESGTGTHTRYGHDRNGYVACA